MLRATIETIAGITGAQVLLGEPDRSVTGLVVDSREVHAGCAFAALPGENADGHEFVHDALVAGARLILVSRPVEELSEDIVFAAQRDAAVLRVDDVLAAVQEIAAWHRSRLRCAVVGVTGSTGKTSTKDFLNAVLGTTMRVAATAGNRNNELGVPLTLLAAGSEADVLVVEMGMRGLGQIARLCEISRPDFGLVTNVGTSHIEILGTQDAVANAKGELVKAIPVDGTVFLNGDDAYSETMALSAQAPVTYYGLGEKCSVRAENVELDAESKASFDLVTPQGTVRAALPVPGRHNVYNALAAAAVALRLAVRLDQIVDGLAGAAMTPMRMETFTSASGVAIVNDAYNANPVSMAAAIDTLAEMRVTGKRVAVLGDMAELGSLSELAHFRIGEQVANRPVDLLVTVGERALRISDGAKAKGMDPDMVRACLTVDEAIEVLDDALVPGDAVLVKASRVMGLEAVVEGIVTPRVR